MQKITARVIGALMLSWLLGIACLFIALQFSPPRWSVAAMGDALLTAARTSTIYALPPLLYLAVLALWRNKVSLVSALLAAVTWVVATVCWWALDFNPVPWHGVFLNTAKLMPAALIPALFFYYMLK
jgi:hypothetical protein